MHISGFGDDWFNNMHEQFMARHTSVPKADLAHAEATLLAGFAIAESIDKLTTGLLAEIVIASSKT